MRERTAARPRYVIINDTDAPEPRMVCCWVPGIGYCYMDRSSSKGDFDGMRGTEATPIEAFGFSVAEDRNGTTWFDLTDRPVTATYRDGMPRSWQSHQTRFAWRRPTVRVV